MQPDARSVAASHAQRTRRAASLLTSPRARGSLLLLALLAAGCNRSASAEPLSKGVEADPIPDVPEPPADGPKLAVLRPTTVYEKPSTKARVLGELATYAEVARSAEPYSKRDCEGGWYVVRPRGFVCVGPTATVAPVHPPKLGFDLTRPLPYRYGRARTEGVPVYTRVPSPAEQAEAEPDLMRHLGRSEDAEQQVLGAAANDVPLDEHGNATGPAMLAPGGEGILDGGKRTVGSFFTFPSGDAPPPGFVGYLGEPVKEALLRKNSGVALVGSLLADAGPKMRRFGITADGHLVPTDRLRPALGSTWHGIDLDKVGLPVAFVHRRGAHTWHLTKGKAKELDDELERRTPVALSGRFRTVNGIRYEEMREGTWLRTQDLVKVVRRTKLPDFATGTQKWLDVSLANQTLTAYEGKKPVYATLVSSGRAAIGDPEGTATARGDFHVHTKAVAMARDPREVHGAFELADAPWVLELEPGYALAGTYWSDPVGEAQGSHDILLTPIDARRLFDWADPKLPEGWSRVAEPGDAGTIVHVRP